MTFTYQKTGRTKTKISHGLTGYSNWGCRCNTCRDARTAWARKTRGSQPSKMAQDLQELEMELEALREENAALRCRLQELEHLDDDDLPSDDEILPSLTR